MTMRNVVWVTVAGCVVFIFVLGALAMWFWSPAMIRIEGSDCVSRPLGECLRKAQVGGSSPILAKPWELVFNLMGEGLGESPISVDLSDGLRLRTLGRMIERQVPDTRVRIWKFEPLDEVVLVDVVKADGANTGPFVSIVVGGGPGPQR